MARIPLPNGTFLKPKTAVVPINVPFLIGLVDFLNYNLRLDLNYNQLRDYEITCTLPLLFANGHIYIYLKPSPVNCCSAITELTKIHNLFMHPSAGKLFNM